MDFCFYKKGYAWFASSAHEHWNALYTDNPGVVADLQNIGLQVYKSGSVTEAEMFYDKDLLNGAEGRR